MMQYKVIFILLFLLVGCQDNSSNKKEKAQKQAHQTKEDKKKQTEQIQTKTAALIKGADSILISKRKVVDKWDKEWSVLVYEFYDESGPGKLVKWQQAINDLIRKRLYRPMDSKPYLGPLNKALIKRSLQAFKKDAISDDITVWYMIDTFKINDHNATFATLKHYNASSTGGAHGMYGMGYNYIDKASGKELNLKDFLRIDHNLLKLAESVFRKTVGIKAKTPFEDTDYSFGGEFYLPGNFELTAQGICFTYNPYEISNWAEGMIEFTLTKGQIKPYLKREI
jgi:hypothetical protein